jgi:DNA-binding PadR family transcriptional regulator
MNLYCIAFQGKIPETGGLMRSSRAKGLGSVLSRATKSRAEKNHKPVEDSGLDLFSGFIKLHVLHHASEQPVYGLWLIEELEEHGYHVSPGTLYPLLHSLEKSELLKSHNQLYEGKIRRYYKITPNGRRQLKKAKLQLKELISEIGLATD